MGQTILAIIPDGATEINNTVSVYNQGGEWTYFIGQFPIYTHMAGDQQKFRLTIAQLITTGNCRPCEIMKSFNITKSRVMRAVKKYKEEGMEGFF